MRVEMNITPDEELITLGSDLVYAQKKYWCDATYYPLRMSILHPRRFFSYDQKHEPMPVIVWLCGGGWTEIAHNAWVPELSYFGKAGYIIASVEYSLSPTWTFPEQLMDIKAAIRYLRAHAIELDIDPKRVAVMGESAGGYLAAMVAVTGESDAFDTADNSSYSSDVQAAVLWYPPIDMGDFECRGEIESYDKRPQGLLRGELEPQSLFKGLVHLRKNVAACRAMDPRTYVSSHTPPTMLLHGTADTQVSVKHSEQMYEALRNVGLEPELLILNGAEHADARFVQPAIKERVLAFLDANLK